MIRGLHYEPDLRQRYEQDYWQRYKPGSGQRYAQDSWPRYVTAQLDLWASGPTTQVHINGHLGTPGASSRNNEPQLL